MKKVQEENATLKISFERKRAIFKKILNEHHIVAIEEHIRVFLLGIACKKKCIVRCRRRHIACLAHSPTSENEQNRALSLLITGQIQKTRRE
jgi:hypothetical protein